jgi:hypothetical protein
MGSAGQSIFERKLPRATQLAVGFVAGTTVLYGATGLFNLMLAFPDATSHSERRLIALVLYPTAAAVTIAAAVAVLRSGRVGFRLGRRAGLAAAAGIVLGASAIAVLWAFGAVGGFPVYAVFATPIAVAAAIGRARGTAAAVILSWTTSMVCASAWLAHAMQHV